jgi:hypothetical protein
VDDIGIVNGTINSGSFTKVSATQYTIMVTPSLGGKHSNVAITTEINNTTNTLTDISDNGNTHTATTKNTTQISYLKNLVDIDVY